MDVEDTRIPRKWFGLREAVMLRNMWRNNSSRSFKEDYWFEYHKSGRKVFKKNCPRIRRDCPCHTTARKLFQKISTLARKERKYEEWLVKYCYAKNRAVSDMDFKVLKNIHDTLTCYEVDVEFLKNQLKDFI